MCKSKCFDIDKMNKTKVKCCMKVKSQNLLDEGQKNCAFEKYWLHIVT